MEMWKVKNKIPEKQSYTYIELRTLRTRRVETDKLDYDFIETIRTLGFR